MRDRYVWGALLAVCLSIPIGILDLLVAFNRSIGTWAALFFVVPYAIDFGLAGLLISRGYGKVGRSIAIAGGIFATLTIAGILFLALLMSAATEFG